MKSITNRKKNSGTDRILFEQLFVYTPAFTLPPGFRAACHLHEKPMLFRTMEQANTHIRDRHRVWKG